jgi:hypothetical protein
MFTFKACDVVYFKFNKLMVYANDGSLEKVQVINEKIYGIGCKFHNFGSFDVLDGNMLKSKKGHGDGDVLWLSNIMSNMFNSHINSLMSKLANVE